MDIEVYKHLTEALFFLPPKAASVVSGQESNLVHIDPEIGGRFSVILSTHQCNAGHRGFREELAFISYNGLFVAF